MLAGTLMLGACTGTPPVTKEVSIVPITNHLEETNGAFVLKSNTSIGVIDAELIPAAEFSPSQPRAIRSTLQVTLTEVSLQVSNPSDSCFPRK